MNVLVIDVGGTHVKCLYKGRSHAPRKFESGPHLTARQMVRKVRAITGDWRYGAVSIGYPGVIVRGRPVREPRNLGPGWVGFNFTRAFGCPVRMINDAAMQALGNYRGGRMLFLGLGTGLGTALIIDGVIVAMELAHLPYRNGRSYEDYLGKEGLDRLGKRKWRREVSQVIALLSAALEPDSVVIGGGNAAKLRKAPKHVRIVSNSSAFAGGIRLWGRQPSYARK